MASLLDLDPPQPPQQQPSGLLGAMADPDNGLDIYDYSARYNRDLSPEDERKFQAWAAANNRSRDTYDYDLRGFWKDGGAFADNGHGTDIYKKPNHPTFSDQSMYHGADGAMGGRWGEDSFTPSDHNLQMMSPSALQRYFEQREPGLRLILRGK